MDFARVHHHSGGARVRSDPGPIRDDVEYGTNSGVVLLGLEAHRARRRACTLPQRDAKLVRGRSRAQGALALIAALSVVFFLCGPLLSRLTKLPIITIYLAAGLLCQLFISPGVHKPLHDYLQPMHNAALGCITLAAGGELVLEQLRANARAIGCITFSLSAWSLLLVFPLTLSSLMRWELLGTGSHAGTGQKTAWLRPRPRPQSPSSPYRTGRCWPAF